MFCACVTSCIGKIPVVFSQPNYYVTESSGKLTVTLLLTKGISVSNITVTVIASDQSPVSAEGKRCVSYTDWLVSVDWSGNGVDYASTSITANFTAGTNSTTINIPVTMDDIVEGTEMFNLGIIIPSSTEDVILGKQNTAIVHIYDSTG